jgi:hypothetical protein
MRFYQGLYFSSSRLGIRITYWTFPLPLEQWVDSIWKLVRRTERRLSTSSRVRESSITSIQCPSFALLCFALLCFALLCFALLCRDPLHPPLGPGLSRPL